LAFLFMGTSPVRHSAINLELRSVAELSHRSIVRKRAFYYQQVSHQPRALQRE
jgi:hypothetical protein